MARYINIGKYKGQTIEDLLTKDPKYLLWALENNVNGVANKLTKAEIDTLKQSTVNSTPAHKNDGKTQIEITCKGTVNPTNNENVLTFTFYGIDKTTAFEIRNALDKNLAKFSLGAIVKGDALLVRVKADDLDKWLDTGMKTLQSFLIKSGKYDNDEVLHLTDEAYARSGNGATRGDKISKYREVKNSAIEYWQKYLETLNDPETIKIIEAYSSLPLTDKVYGHTLSRKNAMLIRSVNNDATFILPLKEWRKLNRGVKRGAKQYVIYIPTGTPEQIADVKDVIKNLGWGNMPYDDLPTQVQKEVDIKTNGLANNLFKPVYEYDISDTYLFPGQPDIFSQTLGLKNNLTGELNDLAKSEVMANSENAPKPDEIMKRRTIEANNLLIRDCEEKKIQYTPSNNPSINLINALEARYKKSAMDLDILRDTNINMFAENATHITLLIGKIAYDALGRFTHGYKYTRKEVGEMINAVGSVLSMIDDNRKLNESYDFRLNKEFVSKFMKAFYEIGCSIKDEKQLSPIIPLNSRDVRRMVAECVTEILKKKTLTEAQNLVDNFDLVSKILSFNSPDDFYFVQIIKRLKDNPNDDKNQGNYHAGGWYLKGYRIRSIDDLMNLKPEIIKICHENNARAYITVNSRSEKETNDFIKIYRKKYPSTDPRHIHADDIIPGQAKDGPSWKGQRSRLFLDVDVPKDATGPGGRNIWDEVRYMLNMVDLRPLGEYETPSGGLHIILPDKEDKRIYYLKRLFSKFDNWKNRGKLATVHPNIDGKIILYSNVQTKGY